jgi:branched-chain amino acid transport system ATP-binding protein
MVSAEPILLRTESLNRSFGGVNAVKDLDLSFNKGIIQGLIGSNGAGKTTLFNLISGIIPATKGKIFLNGMDITRMKPNQITEKGIARTYQTTNIFKSLTVLQNVVIANHLSSKVGLFSDLITSPRARRDWNEKRDRAMDQLQWIGLADKENTKAANLPLQDQKILALALALALNPDLLLLDEPTAGLNDEETNETKMLIQTIQSEKGITVVIIEHKMKFVMDLCDHIIVLNEGSKLAEGKPSEIVENEKVIKAYLGAEELVL